MAYQVTISAEAESQLRALTVREQRMIEAAVNIRLLQNPTKPSKSVRRLRPNPLAEFELRVGDLRALYNVEAAEVILLVFGRKVGNKLIVKGKEFYAHQDNPPEPPRREPPRDAK